MRFGIQGLSNISIPFLMYNGKRYALHFESDTVYASDPVDLVNGIETVEVWVGDIPYQFRFKAKLGTEETDLFDDLF